MRGDVAFNRWVVRALEEALGEQGLGRDPDGGKRSALQATPVSPRAPEPKDIGGRPYRSRAVSPSLRNFGAK